MIQQLNINRNSWKRNSSCQQRRSQWGKN